MLLEVTMMISLLWTALLAMKLRPVLVAASTRRRK